MNAATMTPAIPCRCCGKTLDAVYQPPLVAGREGMWLITCRNEDCGMWRFTFSQGNYATVQLDKYLCGKVG